MSLCEVFAFLDPEVFDIKVKKTKSASTLKLTPIIPQTFMRRITSSNKATFNGASISIINL